MKGKSKKLKRRKSSFLCSNEIIITTKEARKIIGKKDSTRISDEDLARLIGLMHKIASDLIDVKVVPKNKIVV